MKKRSLRVISLFLALLCIVSTLASCANSRPVTLAKNGETDYVIVYDANDRESKTAANYLAAELEELTGVKFTVQDDTKAADKKVPEILVGRTNRGLELDLQRTLRAGEYVIAREKKNVYILAEGTGIATKACKEFLSSVLSEDFKVAESGEILRTNGRWNINTVTLNSRPINDYTFYYPLDDTLCWRDSMGYVEAYLSSYSGFLFNSTTYTSANDLPYSPAIVLNGSTDGLGEGEYKIEIKGDNIHVSAGSKEGAQAVAIALMDGITNGKEPMNLTLSAASGKATENAMVPLTEGSSIRVMTFNVFATSSEHKSLMTYAASSMYAYGSDFVCLQECPSEGNVANVLLDDVKEAGYSIACPTFSKVSPTATANQDEQYTHVGKLCYTPILYRTDKWELVESEAYLYYWKSRYHYTNTKSLAYGVFKSKETNELVLVVSTHFPLMTGDYTQKAEYANCTNDKEGAQWRYETTLEILKEVNNLRAKYPNILTVVGGDMNAISSEKSMQTMNNGTTDVPSILTDGYDLAPDGAKTTGASSHGYGSVPSASGSPIDHIFVSDDVANVLQHRIVKDTITVQGTDHCPVIVDIARK